MRAVKGMILREIAGESILIPTGEVALKIHGMITLSESGKLIWRRLEQGCTEDELVDAVLAEYSVDRDTAAADVHTYLAHLRRVGLVEEDG